MKVQIIERRGEDVEVWATLDDHDAIRDPFGFCIGSGKTRAEALRSAIGELCIATHRLVVEFRKVQ